MSQTLSDTQVKDRGWGATQKYWVFGMQEVQFLHTHVRAGEGGELCSSKTLNRSTVPS